MKILPFGDRALLAQFDSLGDTMHAYHALGAEPTPGILELVPAASTILVRIEPATRSLRATEQWITSTLERAGTSHSTRAPETPEVRIPVRYDGPDLADAADILGISASELVSRHSLAEWQCAFIGFAPGFAYLTSEHANFDIPRLETSRTAVPEGSVALAGEFTGIYPRSSPGGWKLIGTTDMLLWDDTRAIPATVTPGMTVKFEVAES